MSSDVVIRIENLSKDYEIYSQPIDRIKQSISTRLSRFMRIKERKYHRKFSALKDINLEVQRGEIIGVIGRNGAGKSTFLQIIAGTLAPTTGSVDLTGRVAALLELGSGFNSDFTGLENIFLNASLFGLSEAEVRARLEKIIEFADIGEFINQPLKTYSSGMMMRLAFSVVAHVDADILIIDEALAVGDAFFTQKCMRFLREFTSRGTLFFVSHDTASIKNLCSRAVWLESGEVREIGSPKNVCENYLQHYFEVQQGVSKKKSLLNHPTTITSSAKDQRQEIFNNPILRNDLRIFEFDDQAKYFGAGGAKITNVIFLNEKGSPLIYAVGGENVALRVEALANIPLDKPIIGFYLKDKLGQNLFGDNTYISYVNNPVACHEGQRLCATFNFVMPRLPVGDYSVAVAIANGTQDEHVQHDWIHDALILKSESSSVSTGLIGIPMSNILMEAQNEQ
jgi:lipopolysaccharide transport system ATP-binding protein